MVVGEIYCVAMRCPFPLSEAIRVRLFCMAMECMDVEKKAAHTSGPDCSCFVKTKFKTGILGGFVGILFSADVRTERGEGDVTYLVADIATVVGDPCPMDRATLN